MLARLSCGPCSVTTLGEPFGVTAPAISKHLRVLERAGLIDRWKGCRVHYCRLKIKPLDSARELVKRTGSSPAGRASLREREITRSLRLAGHPSAPFTGSVFSSD